MHVYIGIGGNLPETPNAFQNLPSELKLNFPSQLLFSPIYSTQSFKNPHQPSYLNACVEIMLAEPEEPLSILNKLLAIENKLGRKRSAIRWDSRIIDIDILLIDDEIIRQPGLTVPHYQLNLRDFFLLPLRDLRPNLKIPPDFLTIQYYLDNIPEHLKTYPQRTDAIKFCE